MMVREVPISAGPREEGAGLSRLSDLSIAAVSFDNAKLVKASGCLLAIDARRLGSARRPTTTGPPQTLGSVHCARLTCVSYQPSSSPIRYCIPYRFCDRY